MGPSSYSHTGSSSFGGARFKTKQEPTLRPKVFSIYLLSPLTNQILLGQPYLRNLYLVDKCSYQVDTVADRNPA